MIRKSLLSAVATAGFALALAACQPAPTPEAPVEPTPVEAPAPEVVNIVDTAKAAPGFTKLVAAIEAAGLVETLQGPGPFTVFAPNDDAFAKIPEADLAALLADKEKLTAVLTYHVVAGETMSAALSGVADVATVQGGTVKIDASTPGVVKVNDATVVQADIDASNGVIHVIDTVIMPK